MQQNGSNLIIAENKEFFVQGGQFLVNFGYTSIFMPKNYTSQKKNGRKKNIS